MRGKKYATEAERLEARLRSRREYRTRNAERLRREWRAWYDALPEERKAERREGWKAASRAWDEAHPGAKTKRTRASHDRHREKYLARKRLNDHVQRGKIQKLPCAVCGETKVQAHHPRGYAGAAALDVEWLCLVHHREAHVGA
jgi:hypothetical protein